MTYHASTWQTLTDIRRTESTTTALTMAHGYFELPQHSSLERLEILRTKQLQAQFTIIN